MTEQEKIEALKANDKPFGMLDKELRNLAAEIGLHNFKVYGVPPINGVFAEWLPLYPSPEDIFRSERTYRLNADYRGQAGAPEEIEFDIIPLMDPSRRITGLFVRCNGKGSEQLYTHAPALLPGTGYRFAGYRYEDCFNLGLMMEPVLFQQRLEKTIFPIAAVYRKQEN